ncbi:MAG: hypothetical protein ACRYG8_47385, partial [Janthinobacterium lividum]
MSDWTATTDARFRNKPPLERHIDQASYGGGRITIMAKTQALGLPIELTLPAASLAVSARSALEKSIGIADVPAAAEMPTAFDLQM